MATIREIAKLAGVSPSTVSFALNNNPRVQINTRKRVKAAAQALGYELRGTGRPMRKAPLQVAVVVGGKARRPHAPFPRMKPETATAMESSSELQQPMRDATVAAEHHFNYFAGFDHVADNAMFRETVELGGVHGVILLLESPEDGYLSWLLDRKVPLVVVNRRPSGAARFSYVEMDNYGGGCLAAEHFVQAGHHKLAVIRSDPRYNYIHDRVSGFLDAAHRSGREQVQVQLESPTNSEELKLSCKSIVEAGVTALFTTSDSLALSCMEQFEEMGVDVPDKLRLVGFDNSFVNTASQRKPSSIGYSLEKLGTTAVGMLEQLCRPDQQVGYLSATLKTRLVHADT